MLRLLTLGRLDLRSNDGHSLPSVLSQKKRLALLCYLAAREPGSFVQRHAVASVFWPDSTEDRARSALRNALHYLRGMLSGDAILTRGDEEIALDPNLVWCDAAHFEQLARAARHAEALTLYQGPFLETFLPSDIPDFCEWIEHRRATFGQLAVEAARQLALDTSERNTREALIWTQKWLELAPYEERALRAHMQMLMQVGDRAGALNAYESWEQRLARDLDAAPSAESQRLIGSIRKTAAPKPRPSPPPVTPLVQPERRGRRHRYIIAALLLAVLAAAVFIGIRTRGPLGPAMQAFREGETAYDAGRYDVALDGFQRATRADSTFARAHLALSLSANWVGKSGLARTSIDRALQHEDQLSKPDRLLLHAWNATVGHHPMPHVADSLYEEIVRIEPRMAEAWYQLGELRYHWGPTFGYSAGDAALAFERTLELQPNHGGALIHLLRIRARAGEPAEVEKLADRVEAIGARTQEVLEARVLAAAAANDRATFERVLSDLWYRGGYAATPVAAVNGYRPAWFTEALRRILAKELDVASRLNLRMALAHLLVQQGQYRDALDDARALASVSRARSAELVATLLALPFVAHETEVPNARAALAPYLHDSKTGSMQRDIFDDAIFYPRALLLDGLLALKQGRTAEAAQRAAQLDTLTSSDDQKPKFARDYARLLKARMALAALTPVTPLSVLGEPRVEPDGTYADILSFPKALERWTRAEAYERLGQVQEAARWYGTFPDPAAADLAFVAQAHFKRGEFPLFLRLTSADASEIAAQRALARR